MFELCSLIEAYEALEVLTPSQEVLLEELNEMAVAMHVAMIKDIDPDINVTVIE